MRGNIPAFEMKSAKGLDEALEIIGQPDNEWKIFAGGTDLMVLLEAGILKNFKYLNIQNCRELKGSSWENDRYSLGSLTTYSEIIKDKSVEKFFPLLRYAAKVTGAWAIQNRGTLGGNIANASPAADSSPALLVYDAQIELESHLENRFVDYKVFHKAYKQTELKPFEIIRRIILKKPAAKAFQFYRKVGTREAQSISKICLAAVATNQKGYLQDVRIAFGSGGPTPLRCERLEAFLEGQQLSPSLIEKARNELLFELSPIDDIRSTKKYRTVVAQNLLGQFLNSLTEHV